MITNLVFYLGVIVVIVGVILFIKKNKLYKYGTRTVGKVVGIETYTYLTQGLDYNSFYYSGIIPIIEVLYNGKNIRVAYYSIEDCSNLSEGDEIQVIYPKDRVNELVIFNEKEFYIDSIYISIVGVLILVLGLILKLIEVLGSI